MNCRSTLLLALASLACSTVQGQALSIYGGLSRDDGRSGSALPWAVEYTETLRRPLDFGLMYLNQGHFVGHHRDGIAAQLSLHTPRREGGWTFGAGAGPFYYFDTTGSNDDYRNQHGLGVVFTGTANWQFHRRWYLAFRVQHVDARRSFDTTSVFAGLGYRWAAGILDDERDTALPAIPANEIDVMSGRTIVNSFSSQHSLATSIEYRRSIRRWLDGTLTWLNEGDARVVRRNGLAGQLWLVRHAHDDLVELSAGLGPYVALDRHQRTGSDSGERLAGLVSLSARYSIAPRWHARATWHRVLADYHRDTDVFLAGIGYGF